MKFRDSIFLIGLIPGLVFADTVGYRGEIPYFTEDPTLSENSAVYFQDGMIIVKEGYIVKSGEYKTLQNENIDRLVDYSGMIITPGFVDTHVHYPQLDMTSEYGEQLVGWLNTYTFPTEIKFKDYNFASKEAAVFLDQLINNGTTTALVFATSSPTSVDAFFEQALKRNMRMISGRVLMDRNAPPELLGTPEKAYRESKMLIEKWKNKGRLGYAVTPRFAPTSTEEKLEVAGRLLREYPDVYLHTHLAENHQEVQWVSQLFPWSRSYLDVYDKFGLITKRSIFAHAIHLDDKDYKVMSEKKETFHFVRHPTYFWEAGFFNLDNAEKFNINTGLGTDIGAGTSLSLLQTMSEAYKVTQLRKAFTNNPDNVTPLTPMKNLYLATLGGAKVLSLEDKIGSFTPGKEADFVVLNPLAGPILALRNRHVNNINEKIFAIEMLGDDRAVEHTYVMGEKRK